MENFWMISHNTNRQVSLMLLVVSLVATATVNGLLIKAASLSGMGTNQILILRGVCCFTVAFALSGITRTALLPRKMGLQIARLGIAGFILFCQAKSYAFINASSIALLATLNIPTLILVAPSLRGHVNTLQRILSGLLFLVIIALAVVFHRQDEQMIGYAYAATSSLSVVISSIIINKSRASETAHTVAAVPAFASILFGLAGTFLYPFQVCWHRHAWYYIAASGVCMYLLYWVTIKLYQRVQIHRVDYSYALVAILSLPFELLLFHRTMTTFYLMALLLVVALLGVLVSYHPHIHIKENQ